MRRFLPLLLLSTLLLGACGFHLRSALTLPPDLGPVRVLSQDPYSPIRDGLELALRQAGATIASEDDGRVAVLHVMSERWAETPLSVDQFGRAQEYSLRYAVVFRLRGADGQDLVPQQAVELARDYTSSPTELIGTESERELLGREMRREMVASIVRRIDGASRQP